MSRPLSLVLAALLAVFLVGAPASAAPRPPDPEVVRPAPRPVAPSAARVIPASIDSDVYVSAGSPTGRSYFVVAGRLRLKLKSGSTTAYKGSLVDHSGQKSYKASADASDPSAPVVKLEGRNGKFTFTSTSQLGGTFYSGVATSKPKKLKVPLARVGLVGQPHSSQTASYSFVLSERTGAVNNPTEYVGVLSMVYDANGRVSGGLATVSNSKGKAVTHALTNGGYSSASYFYIVAKLDKEHFGMTATRTGSLISGYAFLADGARTSQWLLSGSA